MRLNALHPEFRDAGQDPDETYLYFDCPHCGESHGMQMPLKVGAGSDEKLNYRWGWNGERDMEKVTITPSILLKGHWHGFVTDGEVRVDQAGSDAK